MKAKRMTQLSLIPKPPSTCGGSLNNTRHQKRTLSFKKAMNLTLKADKAVNLLKHKKKIEEILYKQAQIFKVKIYSHTIQKDHAHLCPKFTSRKQYNGFIRSTTALIARHIKKGMWKLRPFTRILEWGRDFRTFLFYIQENELESLNIWKYRPRKTKEPPLRLSCSPLSPCVDFFQSGKCVRLFQRFIDI